MKKSRRRAREIAFNNLVSILALKLSFKAALYLLDGLDIFGVGSLSIRKRDTISPWVKLDMEFTHCEKHRANPL